MRVFEEKQWFNQWWMIIIYLFLIGFPLFGCYKWFILKENLGNVGPTNWDGIITIMALFPIILILLTLFRLYTVIDERGIFYKFHPIHQNLIYWDEMENCRVKEYHPLKEFGGWGYKWGFKGTKAITVKGKNGIQINLKNGKKILVGTQKPNEAQMVIDKYFGNERI